MPNGNIMIQAPEVDDGQKGDESADVTISAGLADVNRTAESERLPPVGEVHSLRSSV